MNKNRARRERQRTRPFVFWDGEGARAEGKRKPQDYVLFGYFDGVEHDFITGYQLGTLECLEFIVRAARRMPDAIHVSFAFGYDVDMILRNLTPYQFQLLKDRSHVKVSKEFRVEHIPGKWMRVTKYGPRYPEVKTDKLTVTIFDVWGFFQSSLIAALESNLKDSPVYQKHRSLIQEGKNSRKVFSHDDLPFIEKYWRVENECAHALVERLRENLYDCGLFISSWHGPGAIASFVYRTHGIAEHKAETPEQIYDIARHAYAGGRFERFHIGRYEGTTFGYDINSAYPNAIAKLPSLSEGRWVRRRGSEIRSSSDIAEFGVYRVKMLGPAIKRGAAPLFHRDQRGNVSFPWRLEGWYWAPEVKALLDCVDNSSGFYAILDGWEYLGWYTRPFAFVEDIYNKRKRMKAAGIGSQMALKLLLNSLYGKMAQRAGWERTGKAPRWHQLEWAGWVTSYTRAMLYRVMASMPYEKLIAVETDGIYSSATPQELGLENSKELGGWEINEYNEIIYLQSGVYAKQENGQWSIKFRGLDDNSFGESMSDRVEAIRKHCEILGPNQQDWPTLRGTTTRFVGYRNALFREAQNRGPMRVHHRVWETEPKEIDCGRVGKRIHARKACDACKAGKTAYEMPHDTIIKASTMLSDGNGLMSTRHWIPWLNDVEIPEWYEIEDSTEGMLGAGI